MRLLNRFASFALALAGSFHLLRAEVVLSPPMAAQPEIDPGQILLSELNCANCHSPAGFEQRISIRKAPVLGEAGLRVTPQYLRRWLDDPHQFKAGTPMPNMLHHLSGPEKTDAVESLVHYLISLQGKLVRQASGAEEYQIQQGKVLYHTIGCVACHAPQEHPAVVPGITPDDPKREPFDPQLLNSIPLGDLARKTTIDQLAKFLADPLKIRSSGRMPSLNLTGAEANSLAVYLLREQLANPNKQAHAPLAGLRYHYYEESFGDAPDFEKMTPKSSGTIEKFDSKPRKREESFGFRFSGSIRIPQDGRYRFFLNSDDGSQLFIDGNLVVDNGGDHAPQEKGGAVDLKAGEHGIVVTFYNNGGGHELKVSWRGSNFQKQEIPPSVLSHLGQPMVPLDSEDFHLDRVKAAKGQQLFVSLGCAPCHPVSGGSPTGAFRAKALAELNVDAREGCLADKPGRKAAKFDLSEPQRAALRTTLTRKEILQAKLSPEERITHTMARLNCYACHTRDGKGGPTDRRLAYFRVAGELDMGDEGRIPPHLTGVGGKLRSDWMHEVLVNRGAVRPYMATRMPQFGEGNVRFLPGDFEKADAATEERKDPELTQREAKLGRKLAGVGGLSCIACHTFENHKSLGIPAMDLTTMTRRLRYDWFHRYLIDPASLRPGTRMPSFWPGGEAVNKEILGGNTEAQINALWVYLSAGQQADLPDGLIQGKKELVAETEPIIYRNFIAGAGTRAIAVGYPEKVNLAFDGNNMRLAMIWQGSFIDAARHSSGRGEGFEPPLGHNIVKLPEGSPFAFLAGRDATWPKQSGREAGYKMLGYALNAKRRPTFSYEYARVRIDDHFEPIAGEVDNSFKRVFTFQSKAAPSGLYYRAAVGPSIQSRAANTFIVNGKLTLKFTGPAAGEPVIRGSRDNKELLIPINLKAEKTTLVEEIIW